MAKLGGGFSGESLLKVQMYVDPEFPALERSVGSSTLNVPDLKKVMWKRPREVAANPAELVVYDKEKLNSCDILQGTLGNCYFLSALSALAENPERVRRLFATSSVNPTGCYAVKFYLNGCLKEVMIDDLIPSIPSRSSPSGYITAFSKSRCP